MTNSESIVDLLNCNWAGNRQPDLMTWHDMVISECAWQC